MDKQKKFKISIIDILVVLIIVAAVAVAAVVVKPMFFGGGETAQQKTSVVTLELAKQKEYMTKNIKEGELAIDANLKTDFGKVISYEVKPATETVVSETDGTAKTVEIPERYDIYVKFETGENVSAQVGKLVTVYTKSFKASGYIVDVEGDLNPGEKPVDTITKAGEAQ